MILIGQEYGINAVYGSMIGAGVFGVLVAVPFSKLLRYFPPTVRGAAVTMIGLQFGNILTGAAVTEVIFGRPGVGSFLAMVFLLNVRFVSYQSFRCSC